MARFSKTYTYAGGTSGAFALDSDCLRTQLSLPNNLLGEALVIEFQPALSDAWQTLAGVDNANPLVNLPVGFMVQNVRFSGAAAGTYTIGVIQN